MFLLFTILFIVAISAYIAFRFEGFFHKLLSLGVILTLFSGAIFGRSIVVSGIVFLAILLLLTIVYGVIAKNISISDRISILALSSILLISSWSKLTHQPYAKGWTMALIIPVLMIIGLFIKDRFQMKKEHSFMILWLCYALMQISRLFQANSEDPLLTIFFSHR